MVVNPPIAQLVEQLPLKEMVVGSNPTGRTRFFPYKSGSQILCRILESSLWDFSYVVQYS